MTAGYETSEMHGGIGMKRRKLAFEAWIAIFLSITLAFTSFDFSVYAQPVMFENPPTGLDAVPAEETGGESEESDNESRESVEESGETDKSDEQAGEPDEPNNPDAPSSDSDDPSNNPDAPSDNPNAPSSDSDTQIGETGESKEPTEESKETAEESKETGENPIEPDGATVLCGFAPLGEEYAQISLEKKEPLEQLTARMPSFLGAYTYIEQIDPETGETFTEKADVQVPVTWVCDEDYDNTELESYEFHPKWEEDFVYEEGEENSPPPVIKVTIMPPASESEPEPVSISSFAPLPPESAHILLKTTETLEDAVARMPVSLTAYTDVTDSETGETVRQEIQVPVTEWLCNEDETDSTLEYYTYRPSWDTSSYTYAEPQAEKDEEAGETGSTDEKAEEEGTDTKEEASEEEPTEETAIVETDTLPIITVSYEKVTEAVPVDGIAVSTQEELAQALATTQEGKIVLTTDIPLTATLAVPAGVNLELDGQGFSLLRGQDENGQFNGIMLFLAEGGEIAEAEGSLTLTNIQIDGTTAGNRSGAPAIVDYGCLLLSGGAAILNNYNYGTYTEEAPVVDNGGGIQVFGELTVLENSSITENFADELGGGVYLAEGASLYLHADVITGNHVSETNGYGIDLYAANGSTIHFNPAINLERETFYICPNVTLIELPTMQLYAEQPEHSNVEIFLNVAEDSGYTAIQIAELKQKLNACGIRVLTGKKRVNTTDLGDWYVYDHYDTACWDQADKDDKNVPAAWKKEYGGNAKRGYFPCTETNYSYVSPSVNTIEKWLESTAYRPPSRQQTLAQFREHIYSRMGKSGPEMTFVGYGIDPYVDFLFYDPETNGEKVIEFDVDSSKIDTHTLAGTGFLVNTGIADDKLLYGYLIYYTYIGAGSANNVAIYKLDGIDVEALHNRKDDKITEPTNDGKVTCVASQSLAEWSPQMSIKITVDSKSIIIEQHSKGEDALETLNDSGETDKPTSTFPWNVTIDESKYTAFGPLVAYKKHDCNNATSYTYSNLHMYYTDAKITANTLLQPIQEADFTKKDTKRYFLNLLGNSALKYNTTEVENKVYLDYLRIMQDEGVALITDRKDTPFDTYLGTNLKELTKEDNTLISVQTLVDEIDVYTKGQANTLWDQSKWKDEQSLTKAEPDHPVGNICLTYNGSQIRQKLYGANKYEIKVEDNIYRPENYSSNITPTYELLKPEATKYTDIKFPLEVGGDAEKWPAGEYTVRQSFEGAAAGVSSYAYFTLTQEIPPEPIDPPEPDTPTPQPSSGGGEEGESPQQTPIVEQEVAQTPITLPPVETLMPEIPTQQTIDAPQAPTSDAVNQPKTADNRIPPMPIATGACTVFMLKIILWMYELELGITDEKKTEMVRALIDWAKGTTRPRIYLAIAVIAVILTGYHILKALTAKSRRMVKEKIGR